MIKDIKTYDEYKQELKEIVAKIKLIANIHKDKITLDECYYLYDLVIRFNEINILLKEYEK